MRNGAVAALSFEQEEMEAINLTVKISAVTHFAPEPVLCCVIHTLLIRKAMRHHLCGEGLLKSPEFAEIEEIVKGDWKKWKESTKDKDTLFWLRETRDAMKTAETKVLNELEGFNNFDPFSFFYKGVSGYCTLTLKISLWALHWSFSENIPKVPEWLPEWPFKEKKFESIMSVVLIGADSDTYGATAGPLLAAYHPSIPESYLEALKVVPLVKKHIFEPPNKF